MRLIQLFTSVVVSSAFASAALAWSVAELPATPAERKALEALDEERFVSAREIASGLLRDRPDSVPARYALAVALHDGEGNVPLALRHLREARNSLETADGAVLPGAMLWHETIVWQEAQALSDLGLHGELLAAYRTLRDEHEWNPISFQVWPLMKMGRVAEAREVAARAIAGGRKLDELVAKNGLCAIDGYEACMDMLQTAREVYEVPGLALANAALSALEIGRYEEAERYLLEATADLDLNSNPWRHLVGLYALQGRLGEAVDAARRMLAFGRALPPRLRQHHEAQDLVVAAELLLIAGHPERALAASMRARSRPDRTSHLSGSSAELAAEEALLDRRIRMTLAERAAERAAIAPPAKKPALVAESLVQSTLAWLSGRRVKPILQDGGLRPALSRPDGETTQLGAPEWLYPDAIALFGAGASLALIEELRAGPGVPESRFPKALWHANLDVLEAEARFVQGDAIRCLDAGARARASLPRAALLVDARLALRMASCALDRGDRDRAWPLLDEVLAVDPGLLRREGFALPAAISTGSGSETAARAARLAYASRRFERDAASPFAIAASGSALCLDGAAGARLVCVDVAEVLRADATRPAGSAPLADESVRFEDDARALADLFLERAFAPRLDLSQMDLRSLDGTPVVERGIDDSLARELAPPSAP